MRNPHHAGLSLLRRVLPALGLLALSAGGAAAQLVFDGNVVFNNNATGTFRGQFVGTAVGPTCALPFTAADLGTVTYTDNLHADPLLPNAVYQANVVPDFRPALGSPAYGHTVTLPNDGFFTQTCYAGALSPDPAEDWTQGWTYYDSTGANRQDLHLVGMPDPRPLAVYENINLYVSQTWAADSNYLVRGQLRVKDQASLTIPAGVVVFEERATLGTVIIERGGRIFATGTRTAPIIITTDDAPGAMHTGGGGGLIINGRARTNLANSCAGDSAATEGGAIGYYGGNDDNDDSGVVRYVRVEYAGKEITPNNELNSFTFCAVGRGTTVDHLEAYLGADDSFEWFGGAMDSKYLIGIDGTDDGYDWQMGYTGRSQFVIVRQSPRFAPSGTQNGDKGIEADNNEFDFNATVCSGRSYPVVANFTMVGDKRVGPTFPGPTSGVNWRRGTAGQVLNSIIYDFKTAALKVDDNATFEAHCAAPPAVPALFCNVAAAPIATGDVFIANGAPNPFRGRTNFNFTLPKAAIVKVEIFSAAGRRVASLEPGLLSAGTHSLAWQTDRATPGGVYFYKVFADGATATGKIVRVD